MSGPSSSLHDSCEELVRREKVATDYLADHDVGPVSDLLRGQASYFLGLMRERCLRTPDLIQNAVILQPTVPAGALQYMRRSAPPQYPPQCEHSL